MQVVPTQAVASQTLQANLGAQPVVLNVYQTRYALFVDVFVGSELIAGGVVAENRNRMVRSAYLGFVGDLAFVDTQGDSDPVFTGLGDRYVLVYLEEADVEALAA